MFRPNLSIDPTRQKALGRLGASLSIYTCFGSIFVQYDILYVGRSRYHGLEALVAMVERRGSAVERRITAVQCLEGEEIWAAAAEGRWSVPLGAAALAVVDKNDSGGVYRLRTIW